MECYICHRTVQRHEYRNHVASHLAGDNTGMHFQPDPEPTLAPFSYDTVDYDHHGALFPAQSTSPRPRARTSLEQDLSLRRVTSSDQRQSNYLEEFSTEVAPVDNRSNAHLMPSGSPIGVTPEAASQQMTHGEQSTQPNAFQVWYKNRRTHDFPKYTTVDGRKSEPDSQEREFIQAAEVLRGTTKEEIIRVVEKFEGFTCNDDKKICLDLVRKVPVFPGLVAYIYTHLVVCPRRRWFSGDDWSDRVSELEQLIDRWSKCDHIWCILSCDTMKEKLLKILRVTKIKPEEHKCNLELLDGMVVLNYDILNLAALAALCITGSQKKKILDQRGVQAEKLIELFHSLLEADVELEEGYRRCFFNALVMFSKESGCCPRGIYLPEGAIRGLVSESQGGFGYVYKGKAGSRLVAVKALKRDGPMSLSEYNKQLSKEAVVWRHLRHPNCLPLYGAYIMPKEGPNISAALVSPWMDEGTLSKYLERNPEANRTQLILDVVRGLNYLHSMQPHVAHRDIKPDNILITKKGRACLADFGLVSTFDTDDHFRTATSHLVMAGTYSYMAPEIFNAVKREARRSVNKRACDMYALGCTIYAAYTGKHPFHNMNPRLLPANVVANQRPGFPAGKISLDMWSFVENLWGADPSKRLTAQESLEWMEAKTSEEGVDSSVAPLEEEWEWKGPRDDKCLWSVSL